MGSAALSPESSISEDPKRKVQETQFPGRGPGDGVPWRSSLLRTKGKHEKKDTASHHGRHDRFRLFGTRPAARTELETTLLSVLGALPYDVTVRDILRLDSTNIQPEEWQLHRPNACMTMREGFSGVVITHGTDTMAYTASMLTFMLSGHRSARRADRQPAARQQPAQRRAVQPALRV